MTEPGDTRQDELGNAASSKNQDEKERPFQPPEPDEFPELFFALVGPTGADMDAVVDGLEAELCAVGYTLIRGSKLSELMHALEPYESLRSFKGFEDDRIEEHMDAGDVVRRNFGHGGALAALAISENLQARTDRPRSKTAYLFRSLKHPQEIELLRSVYDSALVVISIYEPEEARLRRLVAKIQRSGRGESEARRRAETLVRRDQEGGDTSSYGQSVRKAFPLADFFLDGSGDVRRQLERLVQLLFRHPCRSPTRDEYAMFVARSTALRSADLSRQVGAAIADDSGEVIAAGCNEVPRPGGGVYWDGDEPDLRDYRFGADPNAQMGLEVMVEVLSTLGREGWLNDKRGAVAARELAQEAQALDIFKHDRVANLMSLVEWSTRK